MEVTRFGKSLDIPVTQEQLDAWEGGMLIQHAMPHLDGDQREFIMTGILPGEWDSFGADPDIDWDAESLEWRDCK